MEFLIRSVIGELKVYGLIEESRAVKVGIFVTFEFCLAQFHAQLSLFDLIRLFHSTIHSIL